MTTEGTVESMYKCLKNIYGDGTGDRGTEGCWEKFVRWAEQGNCTLMISHHGYPLSELI
jgi:hypothetical protein